MLENPFLYSLAMTLVHFLWQGLLVACVLKLLYLFISNKNPQLRYGLAATAMLANLLLPIATFALIYQSDFALLHQGKEAISTIVTSITRSSNAEFSENLAEYFPYIAILWLITVSYLSLKLLYDIRYVSRLTKKGVYPANTELNERFVKLAAQVKLMVMPRLLISVKADIPMAIGWLKPVVLLPASMLSGLTPAQLEMLLLHELAHIKRHDYLVNFMQTLVEILLFFHPAVHWVSTQMRNEREYCSDDIAVQHCCQPIAYARALTETAALCQKHNHSIPQMALAASGGDLKQRVIRLVDSHCTSNNDVSKWFAGLFIVTSLLAITSKEFLSLSTFEKSFSYLPFYTGNTEGSNPLLAQNQSTDLTKASIAKHLLNDTVPQLSQPYTKPENKAPTTSQSTNIISPKITDKPLANNTLVAFSQSKSHTNGIQKVTKSKAKKHTAQAKVAQVSAASIKKAQVVDKSAMDKQVHNKKLLKPARQTNVLTQYKSPTNAYAQEIAALASTQPEYKRVEPQITEKKDYAATSRNRKQAASLIASFPPKYPSIAKRNKVELEVLVHFTIDTHGFVRNIEFDQQGKGKVNYFKRAIRNAMKKWRFEPATINGKAVESQMSKIFSFSLEN